MNSVSLVGRLTRDPELRYLNQTGSTVVRFTLAVDKGLSRQKRMEFEQQGKPTADFINCVAWGPRAETIAQYVRKGQQLAVNGRIETSSYENQEGQRVYTTDVNVSDFTFISGQGGASQQSSGFSSNQGFTPSGYNQSNQGMPNTNHSFSQNNHPSQNQSHQEASPASDDAFFEGFNPDDYGMGDDMFPDDQKDVPF